MQVRVGEGGLLCPSTAEQHCEFLLHHGSLAVAVGMVKRRKADGPAQSVPDEKEAVERAAKRRRGAREPSEAGDRRQGAEPGRKGLAPAAAAAAAVTLAASGRAQSDDGDSVSEGTSCGKNATGGWDARDVTPDSQAGDQKV